MLFLLFVVRNPWKNWLKHDTCLAPVPPCAGRSSQSAKGPPVTSASSVQPAPAAEDADPVTVLVI